MVERRKMFPAILSGPWQQLGNHQDIQNIGMVDKMTLPSTNIHTTFLQVKKGISQLWAVLGDRSQALPAWEGAQRLPGAQMVSATTHIVGGIQVTARVDEELDQGGEVVFHSQVQRGGALLGEETYGWLTGSLPGLPSTGWLAGAGGGT